MAEAEGDQHRRVSETIARALRQEISAGKVGAGSALPSERQIAERFGASRSSAREALRLLQAEGLITNRFKASAMVSDQYKHNFLEPLSGAARLFLSKPGGPSDLHEARVLFECGLARYAARHATDEDIDRLRTIVAENEAAIGDPGRFVQTDAGFHSMLAAIPGNGLFLALNTAVSDWREAQRNLSVREEGADRRAFETHRAVFDAVAAHDPEGADAAMAAHLSLGMRIIWRQLKAGRAAKSSTPKIGRPAT